MDRHFLVLFLVCYCVLSALFILNVDFAETYGVPFGMSDIDRYAGWLGQNLSYRTDYTPPLGNIAEDGFREDIVVHSFFITTVSALGGVQALNWFIPLLIVGCAIGVYYLYDVWGFSRDTCFWGALLFLFASCHLLMFYIVAFYAQLYSLFFFIIALIMYHRRRWGSFGVFALLSMLAHPMIFFIWFFFLVSEVLYRRWYYFLVGLFLAASVGVIASRAHRFLIFYSKYIPEPSVYVNIAVFCFPFLFLALFFSPLKVFRYRYFVWILLLCAPFFHLGRALIYLCLVVCPLAACGFRYLKKHTDYPRIFLFFLAVFWCFWFAYSMNYILFEMGEQMVLRGLSETNIFINP